MDHEPTELTLQGSSFKIEFRRDGARLRAFVSGVTGTLEKAVEYWRIIIAETLRHNVSLLLVIDATTGDRLAPQELVDFVRWMEGMGLEDVRVAYVGTEQSRAAQHETTEIIAREKGFIVRVFGVESDAALWLRHGER